VAIPLLAHPVEVVGRRPLRVRRQAKRPVCIAVVRRLRVIHQRVRRAQGIVLVVRRLPAAERADQVPVLLGRGCLSLLGAVRAVGLLQHLLVVVNELARLRADQLLHPPTFAVVRQGHRAPHRRRLHQPAVDVPGIEGHRRRRVLLRDGNGTIAPPEFVTIRASCLRQT